VGKNKGRDKVGRRFQDNNSLGEQKRQGISKTHNEGRLEKRGYYTKNNNLYKDSLKEKTVHGKPSLRGVGGSRRRDSSIQEKNSEKRGGQRIRIKGKK